MKRAVYVIGMIAICLMVIAGIGYLVGSSTKSNELATPENPVVSPSKKYQLEVVEGFNGLVHYNRFNITKIGEEGVDPEVVFASKDTFRTRDTLYFLWDNKDRVWVYSGDVGTFYWTRVHDNLWEKHDFVDQNISVPPLLKQLKPEFFSR